MYLQKYQTPTSTARICLCEAGSICPGSEERVGCVVTAVGAAASIALSSSVESPPTFIIAPDASVVLPALYIGPIVVLTGAVSVTELIAEG